MTRAPLQALHDHFETLYAGSADPYGARTRWYEQRKRALLLASLPHQRFRNGYEPGCGNGELTARLALRCDRLLAADFSAQVLRTARQRTAALPQVRLVQQVLPNQWPVTEQFDLIVLSEVLYFLPIDAVRSVARHCARGLAADGVLVACDWRPDFAGRACATEAVHAELGRIGLHPAVAHEEDDFSLRVWTRAPRSVAQREGIR
ncbi:class I SAM-dependent DNA methyltransferase [Pseudorhodoferax sp.]|uniref:class I SAM-dependent DNA methyltransferase n=1 Tax=Pseudorhodoferax sp. TaxID=1993553 RepID=UPI002DD65429|nr:class I SAM-dependent methyltransferase [Pseudorhodoferax sp.]